MAWYDDKGRVTYVASYKDEKSMQREIEEATKRGWVVQDTAGVSGHINVGKTAARVALTGGLGLLFGASRSKDKITITFIRDEAWLARSEVEEATHALEHRQRKLGKERDDVQKHATNVQALLEQSASKSDLNRESLEKDLNKALKELTDARKSAGKAGKELLACLSQLADAYTRATSARAQVSPPAFDIRREIERATQEAALEEHRLIQEQQLRIIQEAVVKEAKEWREASEKHEKAQRRIDEAAKELADTRAALAGAPPDRAGKVEKKLQEAEAEEAKRQAELNSVAAEVAEQTNLLEDKLRERNDRAATLGDETLPVEPVDIDRLKTEVKSPQSETAAARPASDQDLLGQIEKLAELNRAGILTDEEFSTKKAELLARM